MDSVLSFLNSIGTIKGVGIVGVTAKRYPSHVFDFLVEQCTPSYDIVGNASSEVFVHEQSSFWGTSSSEEKKTCFIFTSHSDCFEYIKNIKEHSITHKDNLYIFYVPSLSQDAFKKISSTLYTADVLITSHGVSELFKLYPEHLHYFLHEAVESCGKTPLDALLGYMRYAECIQRSAWSDFVRDLHSREVLNQISLFDLSTAFFQKNSKEFYRLWNKVNEIYAPEFWSVYWSDQVWHAYMYCDAVEKNGTIPLLCYKKLPRWFINEGFKKYKISNFVKPLAMLFEYDASTKAYGGATIILDAFFAQWLLNDLNI